MADEGFGAKLWKNVQAIKLGDDGSIKAPVRASRQEGIVVGLGAIAASDRSRASADAELPARTRRTWRRLFRRS